MRIVSTHVGNTDRMVGELITLPLRVGVRATRLWLRVTGETLGLAVNVADRVLGRAQAAPGAPPAAPATQSEAPFHAPTTPVASAPDEAPLPALREAPAHVSEEPELVEELAEPGAEDGAGAETHVREPWDGYDESGAQEVIARLTAATPAELAAVQLYERGHRRRQTILAAVERELRSGNGSGSPTLERNR